MPSALLRFLGLDDLSGAADAALALGVLNGTPAAGSGYDGTSDLDWWYAPDPAAIDGNRVPTTTLAAAIAGSVLTTTAPGAIPRLDLGPLTSLALSNVTLAIAGGAASTPLASSGTPPGHLGAEHLDPSLQSFATAGAQNLTDAGKLCAAAGALSLAQVPIPSAFVGCNTATTCSQCYTVSNSLLDVLVGGCTMIVGTQITARQPDAQDPAAPAAGAGPPYTLSDNAQHVVTGCRDHTGATVDLTACFTDAAYSIYFRFATDRVIVKN